MSLEITDANFKTIIMESDKVALVDFWAEWCGPCRMIGPIVDELSKEYADSAVIGKLNVDNNPEVSTEFGVRSIPTILFFKGGKLVDKQVGVVPKAALEAKLKLYI